jgi:hypothetical protein
LAKELEQVMCNEIDGQNEKGYARLRSHLLHLDRVMLEKFDSLTADVLQHIDYFQREASENFQLSETGKDHSIGIWGNVTKNPRFKIIDFPEIRMSASLPKPLALSNVGIRMLQISNSGISTIYEEPHLESKLHMSCVGGIILLDLVEFPELPRSIESWTIRQSKLLFETNVSSFISEWRIETSLISI